MPVALAEGDADLDEHEDSDQREGDPEGGRVELADRSVFAEARGEDRVLQLKDGTKNPQAGVPQREHGRGQAVGHHVGDRGAEQSERIDGHGSSFSWRRPAASRP